MTTAFAPTVRPAPLYPARRTAPVRGYLPTLDGWRAIAIVLVLIDHAISRRPNFLPDHAHQILHDLRVGRYGVFIFFGISGFLITSRLVEEYRARGRISLRGFYIRRCFRIMPPLFAYLAVIGLLALSGAIQVDSSSWLRALFFFRNYGPSGSWYADHTWSLAVEEHFYLLWPGLLVLVGVRRSVAVGVIAALLIAAWRVISIHNGLVPPEVVGPPDWRTDTQLDALIWGGITGLLLSRHKVRSWLLRWTPPSTAGLMVLLFCGLIVVDWLMPHPQHPQRFVLPLVVSAMLAMTIVRPAQSLSQMLESAPLRWVGRLSYSIYLWQQLFTPGAYIASSSPWLRMLQVKPFNLLALGLTAVASYYLLEKPMMALGHRLAKPVTPGRGDLKN